MTPTTNKHIDYRQVLLEIVLQSFLNGKDDPISQLCFLEQTDALFFLLQVANQEPAALALAQEWSHQPPDILRLALLQYFEKVCLNEGADDFRVLGLPRDANKELIRLHYRQLIKLFHPDRNIGLDPTQVQRSSTRINRAYEALNQEMIPRVHSTPFRAKQSQSRRISFISQLLLSRSLYKLLFLMIMIVLVGIYLKINFDQKSFLIANTDNNPEEVQVKPNPTLDSEFSSNITLNALPLTQPPVIEHPPTLKEEKLAPKGTQNNYKAFNNELEPVIEKNESTTKKEIFSTLASQADKTVPLKADNTLENTKVLEDSNHAGAALATPLSQEKINQLLLNFLDSYNQGNLEALMSTMADDLMTNDGLGKNVIKHTYGTLFLQTSKREMLFENPSWQINGNRAVGILKYKAKVKNREDFLFSNYEGSIRLEVVLMNQQALIAGFYMR